MLHTLDPLVPCRVRVEVAPRLGVLVRHLPRLVPRGRGVPEGIDLPARAGWRDTGVTRASSARAQTRAVRKWRRAHRSGW
eukprot:scaffold48187_cov62-Phaeocystis_antarctica.AAC.4